MQHHCPHCGHDKEEDGFGTLDEATVHECVCEACQKSYYLYIVECSSCMTDSVFTWSTQPSRESVLALDCDCCGHKLISQYHRTDSENINELFI